MSEQEPRGTLHLLRPGAEPPPPGAVDDERDEVLPVDALAAEALLERIEAAARVVVW